MKKAVVIFVLAVAAMGYFIGNAAHQTVNRATAERVAMLDAI